MEVSQQEMIDRVNKELNSSFIKVPRSAIELIVNTYTDIIHSTILDGDSIELNRVGKLSPSWRRNSNKSSESQVNSKISAYLDYNLKKEMNNKLLTDDYYRNKLGAKDLVLDKEE